MIQSLRELLMLLSPKFKGLIRLVRHGEMAHPLRNLIFAALGLALAWGIYGGSAWFISKVLQVELVGVLIPRKLMSLVLLVLISILLISTTISSFSVFFLSEDLALLVSTPIPIGSLYFARFIEMVFYSSWMVLFFGLPVFIAFGTAYHAGWQYYLGLFSLFPAILLLPGALGSVVAVVTTRLFTARRSRDLLVVLSLVGFVVLYLLFRAIQPERWLGNESFGTMLDFLNMFQVPESRFLPSHWMTEALFPLLEGKRMPTSLPLWGLWTSAAAACAVSGWVGSAMFQTGFDRAQTGRVRRESGQPEGRGRGRLLGDWLDGVGRTAGRLTGALMIKDLRVFLRDTNQWLQLLLLGALAVVYLLNFSYLQLTEFSWFTLYTVNHAMMGLVLAGVAVRFIFPAVSLEGRAFWIVRSAPLSLADFLHSKLLIYFTPLVSLGILLASLSCVIVGVPRVFTVVSIGLVSVMALVISSLGVGLGAIYPRFTAENPAKIPTGVGGVTFMILSMGFVILFLLASVYPTWLLYQWPFRPRISRPLWLALSLATLTFSALLGSWLPMWLGRRRLSFRED